MNEKDFIHAIREKDIPTVRVRASWGDLWLQEEDIKKSFGKVRTLADAEVLIDKLIVYISLNHSRSDNQGKGGI